MVIPGIVVAVDTDGSATIVANPVFFKMCPEFKLSFPNDTAAGYEKERKLFSTMVDYRDKFCTFKLKPEVNGFVQPAKIETKPLKAADYADAFIFPRKDFITPAAYCKGGVVNGTEAKTEVMLESASHEYAYLGSPIFNRNGALVGISYADIGCLIAWTTQELRDDVLKHLSGISYVSDGIPVEQAPVQQN